MSKAESILQSQAECENAEPWPGERDKDGKLVKPPKPRLYRLGLNLLLQTTPTKPAADDSYSVSRSWLFRFISPRTHTERRMGLGPLDKLPLRKAQIRALDLADQVSAGIDPLDEMQAKKREQRKQTRQIAKAVVTFRECIEEYISAHEKEWTNPIYRWQWGRQLELHAYPQLGNMPIADITEADILQALLPLWGTRTKTARDIRARLAKVFGYAAAKGYRPRGQNPAQWIDALEHSLPKPNKITPVVHHPALHYSKVPAFMAELARDRRIGARATEFCILTGLRSGPVRFARWGQIDWSAPGGPVWRIPREMMKMRKDFECPLSSGAITILKALTAHSEPDPNDSIFVGRTGRRLATDSLLKCVRRIWPDGTVHGFRSSLRDFAGDMTDHPREVAEAALAHTVRGVEGDYRRESALAKRRLLMQDWCNFITSQNVVPFKASA
jgi:integrase